VPKPVNPLVYLNDVQSQGELDEKTSICFVVRCCLGRASLGSVYARVFERIRSCSTRSEGESWKIDPKVGYAVKNVGGGVYVISDNGWQSAFLVTDEGVIVFDAPASFGKSIPLEVSKVTDKADQDAGLLTLAQDHIGGSAAFKNIKDLKIVALEGVSDFLKEMNDPKSAGAERNIQVREDDQTWWQNSGAHGPSPSFARRRPFIYVPKPNF